MRVLLCKFHFPCFICFCKPSQHIYTTGPLKLENTPQPHVPPKIASLHLSQDSDVEKKVIEEEIFDGNEQLPENCLKSSLKNSAEPTENQNNNKKKTVQWMDLLGKQLVEIREFELSSEIEDIDNEAEDMNRSCNCVIL